MNTERTIMGMRCRGCVTIRRAALIPVLRSTGAGSDVITPMASPVLGGMTVAPVSIFGVPTWYCAVKQAKWTRNPPDGDFDRSAG